MLPIDFEKVHACGNDFILVSEMPASADLAIWCHRHRGIGADGVMVFRSSSGDTVELDHFDPDGSQSFCVNGIRASLAVLAQQGVIPDRGQVICAGITSLYKLDDSVSISVPLAEPKAIVLQLAGHQLQGHFVDVGNPQLVLKDVASDWLERAAELRAHRDFDQGANVTFLYDQGEATYSIRTFERGVEGFTLACGSGALAAACVLAQVGGRAWRFLPSGGDWIDVALKGTLLHLSGPTHRVAQGHLLCG